MKKYILILVLLLTGCASSGWDGMNSYPNPISTPQICMYPVLDSLCGE